MELIKLTDDFCSAIVESDPGFNHFINRSIWVKIYANGKCVKIIYAETPQEEVEPYENADIKEWDHEFYPGQSRHIIRVALDNVSAVLLINTRRPPGYEAFLLEINTQIAQASERFHKPYHHILSDIDVYKLTH